MFLSDRDIRESINDGGIVIQPMPQKLDGGSVDLTLSGEFKIFDDSVKEIDIKNKENIAMTEESKDVFVMQPHQFVLASTEEYIEVPRDMVAFVQGRSSFARIGLAIHIAGFVDPGFKGTITLELSNLNSVPLKLYKGVRICQIVFAKMQSACEISYAEKTGNKYQGQMKPMESLIWKETNK